MEIVFVLLAIGLVVFLYFLFRGTPEVQKPQPARPSGAASKSPATSRTASPPPRSSGASYVKQNLSHLPPQRAARRTTESASVDSSIYLKSDRWDELLVADPQGLPNLQLQWHNEELWLAEKTTGLLVNVGNKYLRRMGIWTVKVRGVNYHTAAVRRGAFQPGATVRLLTEPDNEYDKNAVAIYAADADEPCGYFNKAMAAGMSKLIDSGTPIHAISLAGAAPGAMSDSIIKVLAASPEVVAHLLKKAIPATLS